MPRNSGRRPCLAVVFLLYLMQIAPNRADILRHALDEHYSMPKDRRPKLENLPALYRHLVATGVIQDKNLLKDIDNFDKEQQSDIVLRYLLRFLAEFEKYPTRSVPLSIGLLEDEE